MFFDISLAILAGGKNSRFHGFNKSFIKLGDKRIIDYQIDYFKDIFPEIIIVTNDAELYSEFENVKIVNDTYFEIGPLAGIDAALTHTSFSKIFVISCDMPFFNKELFFNLIRESATEKFDIQILSVKGKIQPLFGIYSKNIIAELKKLIEGSEKKSVMKLIENLKSNIIEIQDEVLNPLDFYNINSPFDLKILRDKI